MKHVSKSRSSVFKFVQYAVTTSLVAFALSSGLAACGKKSGDGESNLTVGSLKSDGNAVTSNTTLSGYPVSLIVQSIQPTNRIAGQQQCGYNNYGQYVCNQQQQQQQCGYDNYGQYVCNQNQINGISPYSTLTFTVSINGQQQQLSTTLQLNGSYGQRGQAQIGGFQVLYQAACYAANCADLVLEVVIGGSYDYRQIGIRKDMRTNKIVKLGEWTASWNSLRNIQQIMTEI
jgi:hypothetical protein